MVFREERLEFLQKQISIETRLSLCYGDADIC